MENVQGISGEATFSECGKYRYWLNRLWDKSKPKILFILLNPSTADSIEDDQTIRKCKSFSKEWGFGSMEIVNLFAFKSTDKSMLKKMNNVVGQENDKWILSRAEKVDLIVAAWGNFGKFLNRSSKVKEMLIKNGYKVKAIKLSKKGEPCHPLYLKNTLKPIEF